MYFDAVLTEDMREVKFNGTPPATREWLTEKANNDWIVVPGKTMQPMTVSEYLSQAK